MSHRRLAHFLFKADEVADRPPFGHGRSKNTAAVPVDSAPVALSIRPLTSFRWKPDAAGAPPVPARKHKGKDVLPHPEPFATVHIESKSGPGNGPGAAWTLDVGPVAGGRAVVCVRLVSGPTGGRAVR